MEDLIVSVPASDAGFVAQLMEKMGYVVRNTRLQGGANRDFSRSFERARRRAVQDHEWTLDEINAEINAVRHAK